MHPPPRRRGAVRRLWTAALAALALPLTMLSSGSTPAQAAPLQCSVDYKTNDWGSGFTADLTLTNRGTDVIDGWTLTYAYAGNQKLGNGWNGSWSQSGSNITVKNASLQRPGRRGRRRLHRRPVHLQRHNTAPTTFSVNGTPCTGAPPAADRRADQPERGRRLHPGPGGAAGGDRGRRGQRDDQQGGVLRRHQAAGHGHQCAVRAVRLRALAVGSHSLVAKAYDSTGASADSTPVGITVGLRARPSSPHPSNWASSGQVGDLSR